MCRSWGRSSRRHSGQRHSCRAGVGKEEKALRSDNPFESELARRHSRYFGTKEGRPVLLSDPDQPPDLFASAVIGAFQGYVLNPQFVCLGAKAAVNHETYRLGV